MSLKGRSFLFFPLFPLPTQIKYLLSPQLSLHKNLVLRVIYETFMMWVRCWFWSNHKIRTPKLVRQFWTKHPWYAQVQWGLCICRLVGVYNPILLLSLYNVCGSHRPNRPVCIQSNYPLHLWSPENLMCSTRSHPDDPVLPSSSSKGRRRMRKLLWNPLAGQERQSAEQYHINISTVIKQA